MRISVALLFLTIINATNAFSISFTDQLSPKGDIVVALDGSGDFKTIQAAINSVPDNAVKSTVILIKNGNYNTEKLIIPASKTRLTISGESRDKTIISYHIYDCKSPETGNKCPAESWALWKGNAELIRTSATLTVLASDFKMENLTIANSAGAVGQALALTLRGDRIVFDSCDILGYQDTILLGKEGMRNFFVNCLILGRTDYIYGAGIGYFSKCEIRSFGGGWVTAPSTPETQLYGFVFDGCNFTYADNSPRKTDDGAKVALGRPWHNYPKVLIMNSNLCAQIHPQGWPTTWNMPYAATSEKLHLYEYNNVGAGADMSLRASWKGLRAITKEEATNYTLEKVLGGWLPNNAQKRQTSN